MISEKVKVTNTALAEFIGKSEGSIRYLQKNKPEDYNNYIEAFLIAQEEINNATKKSIIAAINVKGGVGKSSILNIIAPKVNNSIIINIDFGASAEKRNSANTIDFAPLMSEDNLNINEVLDAALEEYDTVFIDTPGDVSEELMEIVERIDHFIIPFRPGGRSSDGTIETFDTLFCNDLLDGNHKVMFVLNEYINEDELITEIDEMRNTINQKTLSENLTLDIDFTSLKVTMVMRTMEKLKENISQLSARNKVAYRAALKRFNSVSSDILNHLQLKEV
jgi:MinD-like ATPase involved in chromosome partitioning or flagellar assembly